MTETSDPFWQAAAEHVTALGVPEARVFAPDGFGSLLPGCRTAADAPDFADCAAVVLHKGRLGEVPADLLVPALETMAASFANEVFVVLSRDGAPVAADSPHLKRYSAI